MEMEKKDFINYINKLLQEMSVEEKDAWILTQANLTEESEAEDFIMSLTGEKKISYMPTELQIEEFCKKVQNGDIFVEYETHYYEFDSDGRYMDDWEVRHNDPQGAFSFLNRTFRGCHDLICLGEYDLATAILNKICCLEFQVVEAENSEDTEGFEEDSRFTIAEAGSEGLLDMSFREIELDWITALLLGKENHENAEFAEKLVGIMELEMFEKIQPSDFRELISEQMLGFMEEILENELGEIDGKQGKFSDKDWRAKYELGKKRGRIQHLLFDIRKKCRGLQTKIEESGKVSILEASWKQIGELFRVLRYERYIDDQLEIEEVWEICEALVRRGGLEEENWEIRKKVLKDMVSHGYYDCYGCYDPVKELAEKLFITPEEILEYADMLNESDYYAREAADLYRQYGRTDKYVRYLETHLDRASREYVELAQYYYHDGNKVDARKIAEQGLEKCKDDLTELFIFLLQDAKSCKDEERYKKFYASAKRRKKADIVRINEKLLG